jgi:formylglycine-generating enzyme required for sulfatase activity
LTAALILSAPASAQDDPITCGRFERAVARAASAAALQAVMRFAPSQKDCPTTHAQAERKRIGFQSPPPPPLVSPPVSPPVAPPTRVGPPPPVVRADPAAQEAEAWITARDADSIGGYNSYLRRYPDGPNASRARQRIAALTPRAPPPPPPPPRIASLDARTTPASTRAPLVTNPTSLPDFALFRECDGCPEMVVMPAGTFTMGSPAGEAGRGTDEGPQRNVNIRRFAISRFETTWDQWTACVSAGACNQGPIDTLIGQQTWARDAANWGRGQRPAIMVDWNDAAAYAVFVRGRAGGAAYRLPTESEWEYAARAGTSTRWSFGDTESQLGAYAWFSSNAGSKTQPVGGKAANPWGLFDMHGNVWEWVEDCYVNSYSGLATNGAANTTGDCAFRVFRGGSWYVNPRYLRSAIRSGSSPTNRSYSVGFRLSRTL